MAELHLAPVNLEDVYEDAEDPSVGPGWQVRSLDSAEFALRRIGEMKRQIAGNLERKKTEIARIEARCEAINAPLEHGVRWFEAHLRLFAENERERLLGAGKKKSVDLLYGSLGWRAKSADLKVTDAEALLGWCRAQPVETEVLRIKEEPAIGAVKKLFRSAGEVPPGCDVEPEREEFVIKVEETK